MTRKWPLPPSADGTNSPSADGTYLAAGVDEPSSNVISADCVIDAVGTAILSHAVNHQAALNANGNSNYAADLLNKASDAVSFNTAPTITVADGTTVEIDGASTQSVTFTGTTGTLKLDDAPAFSGQVSGLTGSDALDLADVSYGPNTTATFSGNIDGGTLTITNGSETAHIALLGDYLDSGWTLSSDGHGGTVVVDPPLTGSVFPNATNTGISAGTILTPATSNTISAPGVYSGLIFTGTVTITSSNVTLENCLILGTPNDGFELAVVGNLSNVVIQNDEISGAGDNSTQTGVYGIYIEGDSQVTINAVNIHDVGVGVDVAAGQVIVENSYIHNFGSGPGTHYNGIAYFGGGGSDFSLLIENNSIINQLTQTDAVIFQNYFGPINNVTVTNNLLVGGDYPIYVEGEYSGGPVTNVSVTNNDLGLGPGSFGYTDFNDTNPTFTGNVDDGATLAAALPVSPVVSLGSAAAGNYSTGNTLTLTLYTSEVVTVGGTPTLTLNDGGTATYTGGSGTNALTFSYTVAAGQDTSALAVTAVNGTITDLDGNALSTSTLPELFSGVSVGSTTTPPRPAAPVISTGVANSNESVTLTGAAPDGSTVTVSDGGATALGTATASSTGAWSFTTAALAAGSYAFTATDTTSAGTSAASSAFDVTVTSPPPDPPAAPVITTGVANSNESVTLTGTAPDGSTVTVSDGGATALGTTTASSTGAWSFTTADLSAGSYAFTATDTTSAGTSAASSAFDVTVTSSSPPPSGSNLVANGNFATDNFTDWTIGGNYTSTTYGPEIFIDTDAEGGSTYAAGMGSVSSDGTLSQTIATTAGDTYTLSFWLQNEELGTNDFKAIWNGQTLLSLTNAAASGYTEYTYTVTATGSTTTLEFSAANGPSQWDLDNISLTPVGSTTTTPPAAPVISTGVANSNELVTLTGTAPDGATVTVSDGGSTALGTVTASSSTGAWSFTTADLAAGSYAFTATDTTSVGTSAASSAFDVTVTPPPPAAPVIETAVVNTNTIQRDLDGHRPRWVDSDGVGWRRYGARHSDREQHRRLELHHAGLGGRLLRLHRDRYDVGRDQHPSSPFDVTVTSPPPDPPAAPVISSGVANSNESVTLTGTAPDGSTVTVSDGGGKLGTATANSSTGAWSFTTADLAAGSYAFTATDTTSAAYPSPRPIRRRRDQHSVQRLRCDRSCATTRPTRRASHQQRRGQLR